MDTGLVSFTSIISKIINSAVLFPSNFLEESNFLNFELNALASPCVVLDGFVIFSRAIQNVEQRHHPQCLPALLAS
jgi:hypothetical protein